MSVAKRIAEAIDKMCEGDAESALIPTCIALDATSRAQYPGVPNNEAYKRFVSDNLALITRVTSGGHVAITDRFRFYYNHPDLKPDERGFCTIEQILYHVVRCGLLHEARLPATLNFTDEGVFKSGGGKLILPASLVNGLIAAVVGSPGDSDETIPSRYAFVIAGREVPLNGLWGKKDEMLRLFAGAARQSDASGRR